MAGTIADKLQGIVDSKADIAAAIVEKGGTVPTKFADYGDAIRNLPGGRGEVDEELPVLFIDYDGTPLYSYTATDALALSALPDLPSRTGFTNQGWNYTLQEMKTWVSANGNVVIGCNYITTDGKTRIKIIIRDENYKDFSVKYYQTLSNGVLLDWGDGTTPDSSIFTGNVSATHDYTPSAYPMSYTITLTPVSGEFAIWQFVNYADNSTGDAVAYGSMIDEIQLGSSFDDFHTGPMFRWCSGLRKVNIPNNIGGALFNRDEAFFKCSNLEGIVHPKDLNDNNVLNASGLFQNCSSLKYVSLAYYSDPEGLNIFNGCGSLRRVDGLYQNGGACKNCVSLDYVITDYYSFGEEAFRGCVNLKKIIPKVVPDLPIPVPPEENYYVYEVCEYALADCESLQSIKMNFLSESDGIYNYAFLNCSGIKVFDFSGSEKVPTLYSVNAFEGTRIDKKIIVPDSLYDEWVAATNWSDSDIVDCIYRASDV